MSNHLPIRVKRESVSGGYAFEFDQDALIAQAKVRPRVQGWVCKE